MPPVSPEFRLQPSLSFDWAAMGQLHDKGLISDSAGKAKSVLLTEAGLREAGATATAGNLHPQPRTGEKCGPGGPGHFRRPGGRPAYTGSGAGRMDGAPGGTSTESTRAGRRGNHTRTPVDPSSRDSIRPFRPGRIRHSRMARCRPRRSVQRPCGPAGGGEVRERRGIVRGGRARAREAGIHPRGGREDTRCRLELPFTGSGSFSGAPEPCSCRSARAATPRGSPPSPVRRRCSTAAAIPRFSSATRSPW